MVAPTESAEIWKKLLKDLKTRGIQRISLFCTDRLMGMEDAIQDVFPESKIQESIYIL